MATIIKGAGREDLVRAVLDRWYEEHRSEFEVYKKQMTTYQSLADRRPLWSEGRKFLHKMEIPASLYAAMQGKFGGRWTLDKGLYSAFKSQFRVGIIGPEGTA